MTILVFALFLLGAFCEAGETVTYRNETDVGLESRVVGRSGSSELPAGGTKRVGYIMSIDEPFRVRVVDDAGCVVYSLDTTLRELKAEQDLTITIRDEDVAKCITLGANSGGES